MIQAKEVELKIYLGESDSQVREALRRCGWEPTGPVKQVDVYYTSAHKDFIATEECLRVRIVADQAELTWKPPTSQAMHQMGQYWKEEVDLNITGQVNTVRRLLNHLDFVEYVTVSKCREIYRVDESTTVSLDYVEPLGWFIEVETIHRDEVYGTIKNEDIVAELKLGVEDRVTKPYRDLVKAGHVFEEMGVS